MKGVLSLSFVSRGQYSDFDSFLRMTAARERDVSRLLDICVTVRTRSNGQRRKSIDLWINFCEKVEVKREIGVFTAMDSDEERVRREREIRLPAGACLEG